MKNIEYIAFAKVKRFYQPLEVKSIGSGTQAFLI